MNPTRFARYAKQLRFGPIGMEGQSKLCDARVAVVGAGALGSTIAERLARSGVGFLRLIDRDWVELDNLPRQTLYTEADVADRIPKAIAAESHLREINSSLQIESVVEDLNYRNVDRLLSGVDLVMDGCDNFETRFLINDFANQKGVPWVHGGCLGAAGQVMLIVPHRTPCFRCVIPDLPPPGSQESCDSAGVLGPAVAVIGAWQCVEAIRFLTGGWTPKDSALIAIDTWQGELKRIRLTGLMEGDRCPSCRGDYPFLRGEQGAELTVLCGRNSIQILPQQSVTLDLDLIADRLAGFGLVHKNRFFVRAEQTFEGNLLAITVFRDGRAVLGGVSDLTQARILYTRWIGC